MPCVGSNLAEVFVCGLISKPGRGALGSLLCYRESMASQSVNVKTHPLLGSNKTKGVQLALIIWEEVGEGVETENVSEFPGRFILPTQNDSVLGIILGTRNSPLNRLDGFAGRKRNDRSVFQ
jgi:hypothetical protein